MSGARLSDASSGPAARDDDCWTMLANLTQDFAPYRSFASGLGQIFRIASMNVNHYRPGFVGSVDRLRYFVRRFRDNLTGLFALDTAVAGHANNERGHSDAYSFHELMTISVVKPGPSVRCL